MHNPPHFSPRLLVGLLILVQFIHITEFMMVMPLAADLSKALNFSSTAIGLISGSYTIAAALAGFVAAIFIDQISRKRALLFCLGGLIITTFVCVFAWNLHSMIVARLLSGLFGGPMFGICAAYIADYVPPKDRGKAMGSLMASFSLATIIGIPFGLELAHRINWQAPFYALCIMGLAGFIVGIWQLPHHAPYVDPEQKIGKRLRAIGHLLKSPIVLASYGCSAVAMLAGFMIIPSNAAFMLANHGFPRDDLSLLYLVGGIFTIFTQRLCGWLVDRTTATLVSIITGTIFVINIAQGYAMEIQWVPVLLTNTVFMVSMSGRGVAAQALASKVPTPAQRGAFMAVQGSVINIATSLGAYYSSLILVEQDGRLENMDIVASTTIVLSLFVPFLFWYVEKRVKQHAH